MSLAVLHFAQLARDTCTVDVQLWVCSSLADDHVMGVLNYILGLGQMFILQLGLDVMLIQ